MTIENRCKICGAEPAESYQVVIRQGTVFTCDRCILDSSNIANANKKNIERLFAKCAFIVEIWNPSDTRAKYLMELCRKRLGASLCIRISQQVSDLKLRRSWLQARYDGEPLPRVTPAVRWHFEQEFNWSYPSGVSDIAKDPMQIR